MMYRSGYFRKFLIGTATVQAAGIETQTLENINVETTKVEDARVEDPKVKDAIVKDAKVKDAKVKDKTIELAPVPLETTPEKPKRPSELPIYYPKKTPDKPPKSAEVTEEPSAIEKQIGAVRKELWVYYDTFKGYKDKIVNIIETGKAHSETLIEALRQEELPVPRAGAVALSGVAGVVLGLRGGWIKRIFYGSTTAGLMAALCYPKEFQELSQEAIAEGKKYSVITYNFIRGVKPEGLTLPSPSQLLSGSIQDAATTKESSKTKETKPAKGEVIVAGQEEDADSVKAISRTNDQSNPADKDLYSTRR